MIKRLYGITYSFKCNGIWLPLCLKPFFEKKVRFMFYQCRLKHYNVHKKQLYPYSIGCSTPGVYGINCDISCPNKCRFKTCHIMNGTCFGCVAGYEGTFCKTGIFIHFFFMDITFISSLTDCISILSPTNPLYEYLVPF